MINDKDIILKEKFLSISSWEELVDFIIDYQEITETIQTKRLQKKDISYALFDKKPKYKKYQIPKKTVGKFREIEAPIGKLKTIQKIIKSCVELCFTPKSAAHGFVKERSIVSNARQHKGRKYVYNIDLENFFPSIYFGRVRGVFKNNPFNFSPEFAKHLANLCCNDSGVLPQGAATSPIISNLICRALDGKLSAFAKRYKIKFTRYADDITFSSNSSIFEEQTFIDELKKIIESESFKINGEKVRLQNQYQRQVVTGLTVNKKVNVPQKFINDLDFQIWLFAKNPIDAQARLEQNYTKRHRYGGEVPQIDSVIKGNLAFLKMVIGEDSAQYIRLICKFFGENSTQYTQLIGRVMGEDSAQYIRLADRFLAAENEKTQEAKSKNDAKKEFEQQEMERVEKEFKEEFEKIYVLKTDEEVSKILLDIQLKINDYSDKEYLREVLTSAKNEFNDQKLSETNRYLSTSIKNDHFNPFNQEYANIIEKYRPKIRNTDTRKTPKNPQHLAEFLSLFRSDFSNFKNLVHSSNQSYKDVVGNAKYEFDLIGKQEIGVFNQEIPKEIYMVIREFIDNLRLGSRKDVKYDNLPYSIFFKEKGDLITDFNYCYRFANDNNNGVKISEIIKYLFSKDIENYDKIWYLDIDPNIDYIFKNVLTSTYNIALAIEIILKSCKDSSKIGAVRFKAFRWNNKVILRIINLGTTILDQTAFEYLNNSLGGSTKDLITLLTGYCDFNYRANFKDGKRKLSLIPNSNTEGVSENYDPEGFTYELIFYRPLKFLLIDNGDSKKRIEKAKTIIHNNPGFEYLLKDCEDFNLHKYEYELTSFNAVFIHVNNPEYESLKNYLIRNRIPTISFGGGKLFNKITINYDMNDSQFYNNLENYIKKVKESSDLSFDFWEQQIQPNQAIINDLDEIADKIQNNSNISLKDLPDSIKNELFNFMGVTIDLPPFENLRQLINFCKKHKLK